MQPQVEVESTRAYERVATRGIRAAKGFLFFSIKLVPKGNPT